ncbi:GAF domain-containing protein [Pilimelia anulata]|uniref:GAF domain-containing protein n=1 Tax=Pilimelia anulata TaxID=53371 RepID=A0A8J3B539_9ACTN|nr:GAF and ANTAR domain-containing protein [Pilimelia anulata]GGJ87330.1 GAF domain-containing protein [Pilimelia anulata]
MSEERTFRVWTRISEYTNGEPVTLAHLAAAAAAVAGVDGAAVAITAGPTARQPIAATDAVAERVEEWHLAFGEGPAVAATAGGGPVIAVDLESPPALARWPAFAPAALTAGVRAVIALPLQVGAIRVGVLTLYRRRAGGLTADELADVLVVADTACVLLLDGADPPDKPDGRSDHNAVVHQATGMILVQAGISAEAAFVRLRAYAYAHDRRLSDVARDVVARRLRFHPEPHINTEGRPDGPT